MESHGCQPAIRSPYPVGFNGIDQKTDHEGVHTVGDEFGTLRHGTGYNGRCCGAEYQVESECAPVCAGEIRQRMTAPPHKRCPLGSAQQAESQNQERHGSQTEIHGVLHDDVAGVLGSCEPGFHHGESRLHKEYQCGSDQIPDAKDLADCFFDHISLSLRSTQSLLKKGKGASNIRSPEYLKRLCFVSLWMV